jgi:hypothetical protein
MKTIEKLNLEPVATFPQIANELGEKEGAVFECYKRALVKLQVALRRRGYKLEDFFGDSKWMN